MNEGPDSRAESLAQELASLRASVEALTARIRALELAGTAPQTGQPGMVAFTHRYLDDNPTRVVPVAAAAPPNSQTMAEPVVYEEWWKAEWIERTLGGNWLARIGVIAVIVGAAFFMKLAFDNGWIGELGRVVLGGAAGLALLGAGAYWRHKYALFAQALLGGGIGLLYLSCFSAFALYALIGFYPALGLLSLVNLAAAGLAVSYNARALAVIAILGAFTAPFILLGFGETDGPISRAEGQRVLAYLVVVDVGVLGLALFRKWRGFLVLALVSSLICYGLWFAEFGADASLTVRLGYLTGMFLVFVAATTTFHIVRREAPDWLDRALMQGNAAAYFGIGNALVWKGHEAWAGAFSFALAAFYAGLAALAWRRGTQAKGVSLTAAGSALAFVTVALPIQLRDEAWTSVAWAIQAVVLVVASFRLRFTHARFAGYLVLVAGVISLMVLEGKLHEVHYLRQGVSSRLVDDYEPILNLRMLAFATMIAASYVAAYVIAKRQNMLAEDERRLVPQLCLLALANVLTLWVLSGEIIDQVTNANARNLMLTGLWAGYATVLLGVGVLRRSRFERMGGLALLALAVMKLFLFDAFTLERGYRVVSFVGLGLLLLVGGYVYQRYAARIKGFLTGQ